MSKLKAADAVVEQMSVFDLVSPAPSDTSDGAICDIWMDGGQTCRSASTARERQEPLEKLMDELRSKFGENSITLGYQENKDTGIVRGDGRR